MEGDATAAGGAEGDWEQSNEIPGGGTEQQTASTEEGETEGVGGAGSGDEELDEALEGFDGAILTERQIILARSNDAAGTREPPPGASGSAGTVMGDPSAVPSGTSESGGMPEPGTLPVPSATPRPPRGEATASVEVPEDIPDATDDDVVARQLREAAMNEPDPVLREKLWDEYRRYKSGG